MNKKKLNKKYGNNYEVKNGCIVKKSKKSSSHKDTEIENEQEYKYNRQEALEALIAFQKGLPPQKKENTKSASDKTKTNDKSIIEEYFERMNDVIEFQKQTLLKKKTTIQLKTNQPKSKEKNKSKDNDKICDFYISSVRFITRFKERVLFKVEYKHEGTHSTVVIPYEYYNDPNHWVKRYMPECRNLTSIQEFNRAIIEISNNLSSGKKVIEFYKKKVGWKITKVKNLYPHNSFEEQINELLDRHIYYPSSFDESDDYYNLTKGENINSMLKYCVDSNEVKHIGITLVSYLLYSLLLAVCNDKTFTNNNIIMSLTGGKSEHHRNKTAMFFTNVYKRNISAIASDYKFFHILPDDTPSVIDNKALRMNAGIIIAFNPNKGQAQHIQAMFTSDPLNDQYYKKRNLGAVLLVKDVAENIPFKTINISLPEDYNIKDIYSSYQYSDEFDFLMVDIYNYMNKLSKQITKDKYIIHRMFEEYETHFDNKYSKLTEDARNVAMKLTFATNLYWKYAVKKDIIKMEDFNHYNDLCEISIIETISESFHNKNDILLTHKQQAIEICRAIDRHFQTEKNRPKICNIGVTPTKPTLAQVWCDTNTINITAKNIEEILKLENCKYKLNKYTKMALAEMGYIYTTKVGENETTEYSLHIQTPLYEKQKTRERFIRFNRQKCIKHDLLTNIDGISCFKDIDDSLKHFKKKSKKKINDDFVEDNPEASS